MFQEDMNGKLSGLPSMDDISQFVRWADLEDALKGIRDQLENIDRTPQQRIVLEASSQTEVGCTAVQFSSVQDGISALRKAHRCSTVAPVLPLKQFQC